ncbi:hypothetical protein NE865_13272 [Phthorimaea operculella]|nr:hypothetical protein NE865_13272 [Phthorimaea operculella]
MIKTCSESDLNNSVLLAENKTPPSYVFGRENRPKKRKELDSPTSPVSCDFSDFKKEMRDLFASQQAELLGKINPTLCKLQETNIKIEQSLEFLHSQYKDLNNKVEKLESRTKEDGDNIVILEDKMENLQKGLRKANFEIKNVPKMENETKDDLIRYVTTLSTSVGSSIAQHDIRDIYRVRGKQGVLNTPIVVETASTSLKMDILKKCKVFNTMNRSKLRAKHLGFVTAEETPIFVAEQLTPKASRLYFLARELKKSMAYKYCWTAFGNIYVRKDDNSPIITINNEGQIQELTKSK